jgi:hypothetical protein
VPRALLVFVDGVGIGRPGAQNPFDGAPVHVLAPLGGGEGDPRVAMAPVDATLGHPGLPQSATGQAVIFTGEDAIAVAGGHREGLPTRAIAQLLLRRSVLARARAAGKRAALLNAFDARRAALLRDAAHGPPVRKRARIAKPSASALAALAGDGELRTLDDAREGRAVTFDFTGEVCRAFGLDAPRRSLEDAGRTLAAAAAGVDLGIFETFLTDKAGHAQDVEWARHEIVRVERFLVALMGAVDPREQLVVVTSDHGNLEDLSTRSHTRAAVPLMAFGAGAAAFVGGARSLLDVTPRLLEAIGCCLPAAMPGTVSGSEPS